MLRRGRVDTCVGSERSRRERRTGVARAITIAAFVWTAIIAAARRVLWRLRYRTPARVDGSAHSVADGEKPAVASNEARAHRLVAETSVSDQADEERTLFVASIGHEIRTPLNAIVGHLELALRGARGDRAQLDRLNVINDAANDLLATLDGMLELSRIEAGEMSLRDDPFDVVDVYERALAIFSPLARRKGIAFHGHFDLQLNARALGDAGRLGQIVDNLVSNALKFTAQGKVTLGLRGEPAICDDGKDMTTLIVTVEDTGIGIPASGIDRLFQPFARISHASDDRCAGTGLGLALCRRLVTLMGGSIDVDSTPGQGSRFVVRVPLRDSRPVWPLPRFDGEPVVVVSPMAEWRDCIERHLGAWNLCVSPFDSPAEVSSVLLDRNPIVIVHGGKKTGRRRTKAGCSMRRAIRCVASKTGRWSRSGSAGARSSRAARYAAWRTRCHALWPAAKFRTRTANWPYPVRVPVSTGLCRYWSSTTIPSIATCSSSNCIRSDAESPRRAAAEQC